MTVRHNGKCTSCSDTNVVSASVDEQSMIIANDLRKMFPIEMHKSRRVHATNKLYHNVKVDVRRIGGDSAAEEKDRHVKVGAYDDDVDAEGRDDDAVRLGSGRDDKICLIDIVGSEADESIWRIGIVVSAADEDHVVGSFVEDSVEENDIGSFVGSNVIGIIFTTTTTTTTTTTQTQTQT